MVGLLLPTQLFGQVVYRNDFETAAGPEWSQTARDFTPKGQRGFLGQFGNTNVTLTLTNLPAHTEVDLSFDLFIIRSWDGNSTTPPDQFSVSVDGQVLLSSSFVNYDNATQSFPANVGRGNYPPNSGAMETQTLGYSWGGATVNYWDAVYRLNFRVPHAANKLVVAFAAKNLESTDNETWGLDNVIVETETVPANAPPRVTRQPVSQSCPTNGTAVLNVTTTTNAGVSYQWLRNGSPIFTRTQPFLVLQRVGPTTAGSYSVIASNAFGQTESVAARLTVGPTSTEAPGIEGFRKTEEGLEISWAAPAEHAVLSGSDAVEVPGKWSSVSSPRAVTQNSVSTEIPATKGAEFFQLGAGPSLTDFWEGRAKWEPDAGGLGADFGMHFLSILPGESGLLAYYIANHVVDGRTKSGVGRARSDDGVEWKDEGIVLDVGGTPLWIYQSEEQRTSMGHNVGRWEPDGWSVRPSDKQQHMLFGPYTRAVPRGANTARFRLLIDNRVGANDEVCAFDVWDDEHLARLAIMSVHRSDFLANNTWQNFDLPFTSTTGESLEFRIWHYAKAYLKVDFTGVVQGQAPFPDDRLASFPGVLKVGELYYLAYEAAGEDISLSPGDIGLATSTDGLHFVRYPGNPILKHETTGWERVNIGTPSLHYEGGTWHLFYHGFDGTDVCVGVASGSSPTSLVKNSRNPILATSNAGWDAGTVGKRSRIFKEGQYYYFAYEGSTDQPFDKARWSTGLARSTNLVDWVKCNLNPILPRTTSGFGYDGPELVRLNGTWYLYARMSTAPDAPTKRWHLAPK